MNGSPGDGHPEGLTGDPLADQLLPAAIRLVGAVHAYDGSEVTAALHDAAVTARGTGADPNAALAVVLAAMVAQDETPTNLLYQLHQRGHYERLLAAGVDPAIAQTLITRTPSDRLRAEGRRCTCGTHSHDQA